MTFTSHDLPAHFGGFFSPCYDGFRNADHRLFLNQKNDRSSANNTAPEWAHDYDGAHAGAAVGEFGDLGAAGVAA